MKQRVPPCPSQPKRQRALNKQPPAPPARVLQIHDSSSSSQLQHHPQQHVHDCPTLELTFCRSMMDLETKPLMLGSWRRTLAISFSLSSLLRCPVPIWAVQVAMTGGCEVTGSYAGGHARQPWPRCIGRLHQLMKKQSWSSPAVVLTFFRPP